MGGGDGLVRGCRGHGACGGDGLAIHCLVAGIGVCNGLWLGGVLLDGLVLVLMLVLHLVLGNGLHRHRRTHVHVEGWQSGGSVGWWWIGRGQQKSGDRTRLFGSKIKYQVKISLW